MDFDQNIKLAVDNVVFTIKDGQLHVLLVQRNTEPFKGQWTLSGGFVMDNESLKDAAYRKLEIETDVDNVYLEQLYTFGEVDRDPRSRIVSTSYMAVINHKDLHAQASNYIESLEVYSVDDLPEMAFDHEKIINYGVERLKNKLEYTNIAQFLLPDLFSLSQLQNVYEVIFEHEYDTRNFRKKIKNLDIIEYSGQKQKNVQHRPAKLYQFKSNDLEVVEIF